MANTGFSGRFCRKCLQISLPAAEMIRFAKMVYPGYDIYQRTGYPKGHPIAPNDAASRIVIDMIQDGYYLDFVEMLLTIDSQGYMGHRYPLRGLDDVIDDIIQAGYSYDKTTKQFFENQRERITRNWGRLLEGDERQMAVLRLDIAGNSILVKENKKQLIDKAYSDLRKIVTQAVISRLGRLWTWEGDGALGAFMLGDYGCMAICAGMEVLNEMFFYNMIGNPLNAEIKLRISVFSGNLVYSKSETENLRADIVKKAIAMESKAALPNSMVISEGLAATQDQVYMNIFSNIKATSTGKYRMYQVFQERRNTNT